MVQNNFKLLLIGELSMDQTAILQLAESNGGQVNVTSLRDELGWELERSNRSLDKHVSPTPNNLYFKIPVY